MRIGVDARALTGFRGVTRYARSLLAALAREYPQDEWRLFVPGREAIAGADELRTLPNVVIRRHPLTGRALFGAAALTRRPRLDRLTGGSPDVVWAPTVAPLALSSRVPLVLTVQDLSFELRPRDFTGYERVWHALARPRALARRAGRVVVLAEPTRDQLVRRWGLSPSAVTVVAPGVADTQVSDPATLERHGLQPGSYLLAVGALEPRKAPTLLAAAFARARERGLGGQLVFAGDGRLRGQLGGPGVTLLGRVSDPELGALYAGALALVMPSLLEGYGLPVREALAHGTPAVISDLPVFGDELDPAVLRVPPGDETALSQALLRIAGEDGLRERLAGAASRHGGRSDLGGSRSAHPGGAGRSVRGRARTGVILSVVIPNWNGMRWLPGCLASIAAQELAATEVIVVDNGSTDGSVAHLRAEYPSVTVIELGRNTGFAVAANRGLRAAGGELIALINTDVVLELDWTRRMVGALAGDAGAASVACKMLDLADPRLVYDAGDVLRRDGACDQRGRFGPDEPRFDQPGEVFGACAGAALYRRAAVLEVGGFDERYFAYLEDVDLALRLRLAGWRCRYEPAVALHAGEGSSHQLAGAHHFLVQRNTMLLVGKAFPLRWLPLVAYRQLSWLREAARQGRIGVFFRATAAGLAMAARVILRGERRALRRGAQIPVEVAVPKVPIRGAAGPARRFR